MDFPPSNTILIMRQNVLRSYVAQTDWHVQSNIQSVPPLRIGHTNFGTASWSLFFSNNKFHLVTTTNEKGYKTKKNIESIFNTITPPPPFFRTERPTFLPPRSASDYCCRIVSRIVSRDSFGLWTRTPVQTARSTAYFYGCPYIFWYTIILLYMYDLSALVGCWSSVSIRRIIYKFLNACPFAYTAVAVSGKVEPS